MSKFMDWPLPMKDIKRFATIHLPSCSSSILQALASSLQWIWMILRWSWTQNRSIALRRTRRNAWLVWISPMQTILIMHAPMWKAGALVKARSISSKGTPIFIMTEYDSNITYILIVLQFPFPFILKYYGMTYQNLILSLDDLIRVWPCGHYYKVQRLTHVVHMFYT